MIMIIGFIISVIAAFILFFVGVCNDKEGYFPLGFIFCTIAEFAIVLGILLFSDNEETPRAIDVYRGKTTLEITYKDGIAIDTVVVWKEE